MRVLVCGGRDYMNEFAVHHELMLLAKDHGWLTIIEGGQRGADRFAQAWARRNYHGLITVDADWSIHGRAGGPIRNAIMLTRAKPDLVLAFPSPARGLEGTGTGDMVERARAAGVEVRVIGLEKKGLFE